jgi:benzoate-CoA ligase family protein
VKGLEVANAAAFYVDRNVEEGRAERPAVRGSGQALTYGDVLEQSARAAHVFREAGVDYEDRVILLGPDSPAYVVAFWALVRLGAVPVPVSHRLAAADWRYMFADCRASGAVVAAEYADAVREIRAEVGWPPAAWVLDSAEAGVPEGFESLPERIAEAEPEFPPRPTSIDDMALIQYTSGSTGAPKGVVHLHRGLLALDRCFPRRLGLSEDDVCFSAAPLSFGYGLGNSVLFPFGAGASSVLSAGLADPYSVFDAITRERPTVFFAVPGLYSAMLGVPEAEERFDVSSVRTWVSGGDHVTAALFERWRRRFGAELLNGMGSTECLHIFISGEPGRCRPGATGTPAPGCDIRLLDDEAQPVAVGEVGHLHVRSDANGARYWNKHPETTRTMLGAWTRTGDTMVQDADGVYTFVGRADDLIKIGALKVSPIEIEAHLLEHDEVAECAVVVIPNEDGINTLTAYVRPVAEDADLQGLRRRLRAYARSTLPGHKRPRVMEVVRTLPRTPTGKVSRHKLRAAAASGHQQAEAGAQARDAR